MRLECVANEWQGFFFISISISLNAIVSGSILSFVRILGEFGATLMFAGNIPGRKIFTNPFKRSEGIFYLLMNYLF